jgi:ketosteroid isomerase-like protein
MPLTHAALLARFDTWLAAWDAHDLDGVMAPMHVDVVFENWTGATVRGKRALRRAWAPWFKEHGNFRFSTEDVFVDEAAQKLLFRWSLEWPAPDAPSPAREIRRGVDVLHFIDGLIREKHSYSKTATQLAVAPPGHFLES